MLKLVADLTISYAQPSIGAATLSNFKPQSSSQLELLPPKLSPNSRGGVVGNQQGVGVRDKGCNKKTRWCGLHITPHVLAILQQVRAHTVHVLRGQNAALSIHVPCHFGWITFVIVVGRTGGGADVHHWVSDWFVPGRVEHLVFLFWPVHNATDLSSHKGRWIYGSIEDTTQATRQNPVNGPGCGMDAVKLIGVGPSLHLCKMSSCSQPRSSCHPVPVPGPP